MGGYGRIGVYRVKVGLWYKVDTHCQMALRIGSSECQNIRVVISLESSKKKGGGVNFNLKTL